MSTPAPRHYESAVRAMSQAAAEAELTHAPVRLAYWRIAALDTLLDRLETKGIVTSDRSELAFVYRPTISAQEVRQKRVSSLVDKLYQGEPGLLVLHLLKSHPLDPRQAKEVRAVLEEMTGVKARKRRVEPPAS